MKECKTLLMTVVYPGVEMYLDDYFSSVCIQSNHNFDLLIIADNCEVCEVPKIPGKVLKLYNSEDKSLSLIRFEGIRYAIENNYDNLIFSDCDDYFSDNRIDQTINVLNSYDFISNEICLVNEDKTLINTNYMSDILTKYTFDSYNDIIDFNIFGLSNTGFKLELFNGLPIPDEILAADWWIFTLLLLNGAKGKFVKEAITFYRQTNNNLVGMNKLLDKRRLLFGIKVKTLHYSNVLKYCIDNNLEFAVEDYSEKLEEMEDLAVALKDEQFMQSYIETVNNNIKQINKGWWSEIIPLKVWNKYKQPSTINLETEAI